MSLADAKVGVIYSEEVEPTAAMIVGRLFARCQAAEDYFEKESAYANLWWAVNALNSLSVAIRTATHFSLAANNHVSFVRQLVIKELDIDPDEHPMWKFR